MQKGFKKFKNYVG